MSAASQSAIATIVPRQAGVTKLSVYVSSTTAAASANARSTSPRVNWYWRWCALVPSSSWTSGAPGSSAARGSKTAASSSYSTSMRASARSAISGVSAATAATSSRFGTVLPMMSKGCVMVRSEPDRLLVLTEHVLHGARDLAQRRVRPHGFQDGIHEVARGARLVGEVPERAGRRAVVAVTTDPLELGDLRRGHLRVEGVQLDLVVGLRRLVADVAVGADLRDLARDELLLEQVGLARDLGLERAAFHGLDDAAHALDPGHLLEDLRLHGTRQRLDVVRARERVYRVRSARLLGADLHGAERDELRLRRRDRAGLVVGRQRHRLSAGQCPGEGDVGAADDVVLGLLDDKRRAAAPDQRSEHPRFWIFRAEPSAQHARVQAPARAELRDLLEDLPPRREVERDPRREVVDEDPAREHELDVRGSDLEPVRHLLRRRAARLTDVVAARSEEHTSELQSPCNLVCRLLLEKKKKKTQYMSHRNEQTREQ